MPRPDAQKLPPLAQEDLRRRVVSVVRDGMGKAKAARTFGVSRQSEIVARFFHAEFVRCAAA